MDYRHNSEVNIGDASALSGETSAYDEVAEIDVISEMQVDDVSNHGEAHVASGGVASGGAASDGVASGGVVSGGVASVGLVDGEGGRGDGGSDQEGIGGGGQSDTGEAGGEEGAYEEEMEIVSDGGDGSDVSSVEENEPERNPIETPLMVDGERESDVPDIGAADNTGDEDDDKDDSGGKGSETEATTSTTTTMTTTLNGNETQNLFDIDGATLSKSALSQIDEMAIGKTNDDYVNDNKNGHGSSSSSIMGDHRRSNGSSSSHADNVHGARSDDGVCLSASEAQLLGEAIFDEGKKAFLEFLSTANLSLFEDFLTRLEKGEIYQVRGSGGGRAGGRGREGESGGEWMWNKGASDGRFYVHNNNNNNNNNNNTDDTGILGRSDWGGGFVSFFNWTEYPQVPFWSRSTDNSGPVPIDNPMADYFHDWREKSQNISAYLGANYQSAISDFKNQTMTLWIHQFEGKDDDDD